jgi:hypothetical protein
MLLAEFSIWRIDRFECVRVPLGVGELKNGGCF